VSSQQPRITLAGSEYVVEAGTTAGAALLSIGCGSDVIAARVNGVPRDLAHVLADGDEVEPIVNSSDEGHAILRHSTAHVLAQAVQDLQDRRLGLEEAAGVQFLAQRPGDRGAQFRHPPRLRVDDQVEVALAHARLGVVQASVLFRQRPQRLGRHLPAVAEYG